MPRRKQIGTLILASLLILGLFSYFYFNKKIISGFPPPEKDPEWLPSPLLPHPDISKQAWLFTRLDPESDFIQVYLYSGNLSEGFGLEEAHKLTSSAGDKSQPHWGPVVEEGLECLGQTVFFLADDGAQREEAKNIHFVCIEPETFEFDPDTSHELSWTHFPPEEPVNIEFYDISPTVGLEISFSTLEGRLYYSTEEAQLLWNKGNIFVEYTFPLYAENDRYLFFKGLSTDGTWQLGAIDMMSDAEIQMTALTGFETGNLQKIPNLPDALLARTPEGIFVLRTSINEEQKLVWGDMVPSLPLPKNFSGKQLLVWGGTNRQEHFLEILPELVSEEGEFHEIGYAKARLPEPANFIAEPVSRLEETVWEKETSLTCLEDSRNPSLIVSGNQPPVLFYFKPDTKTELAVGTNIKISESLNKSCECTKDEECDDGSPCTEDRCVNHACDYQKTDPNCCNNDKECVEGACVDNQCADTNKEKEKIDDKPKEKKVSSCINEADCADINGGNLCKGVYYCDKSSGEGECKLNSKSVVNCSTKENTECAQDLCNPKNGKCEMTAVADGTVCQDGFDACFKGNVCKTGICAKGKWDNADPKCQCQDDPDCAAYEDGNACNGTLYCDIAKKKCLLNPTTIVTCPPADNTACSENQCNTQTGKCEMKAIKEGLSCDDFNQCSSGDKCGGGKCLPGSNICECEMNADCAGKNKGDLCQGVYYCDLKAGKCVYNEATKVICPTVDDTVCAKNLCNSSSGKCAMTLMDDGTPCNADGQECTKKDQCQGGKCTVGEWDFNDPSCECGVDSDCAKLEDKDLCNGTLYCDKANHKCLVNPKTIVTCPQKSGNPSIKTICKPETGKCENYFISP